MNPKTMESVLDAVRAKLPSLVFYKGNPAEIANNYPAIEYDPSELVELAGESVKEEEE